MSSTIDNTPATTQEEQAVIPDQPFGGGGMHAMIPPYVIYQTRKDYHDKVPVTLSEDKSTVLAYPGRGDIFSDGGYATPLDLGNGYLLDRRGIGRGTAFLDLTYEEYEHLDEEPDASFIMKHILDKDPLLFLATIPHHKLNNDSQESLIKTALKELPKAKVWIDKRPK